MSDEQKGAQLLSLVRRFMTEQRISCPETIYQTDRVIENAYEFVDKACGIVGYPSEEEDEA
jgi:hypothetical protein